MQKIFQNPFDKPYIFERQTSVQIRFHSWKDANLVTFSRWVVHVFTQKVNSLLEKISFDRKSSLVHTYVEIRELRTLYVASPSCILHWPTDHTLNKFSTFFFLNVFLSLSHFHFSERLFILKTVEKLNMNHSHF